MKRLHIHISVAELAQNIQFYSTLFNSAPTTQHDDYAKWDLIEPAVNFAISSRGDNDSNSKNNNNGLNHLGLQVDSTTELNEIAKRFVDAKITTSKEEGASCCYAKADKYWTLDPQGIPWESFHTLAEIKTFNGENSIKNSGTSKSAPCCVPSTGGCCSS